MNRRIELLHMFIFEVRTRALKRDAMDEMDGPETYFQDTTRDFVGFIGQTFFQISNKIASLLIVFLIRYGMGSI